MKYSNIKKLRKVKQAVENVLFFPIICVCTPIYKLSQELKKKKIYSEKQIRKVVQYLLDYWSDGENEFYVLVDDDYNPFDYSNVQTPFHMYADMSWSNNKSVKKKASSMYFYQKEQFLTIFKQLCGEPMTNEEKKQFFKIYEVNKIKDRIICKVK